LPLRSGRISSGAASDEESEYAASRYVPALRTILEELTGNRLSMEDYPSVLPMPDQVPTQSAPSSSARGSSARSSRSSRGAGSARKSTGASSRWSKSTASDNKRSSGPTNYSGGRCIVFMMGGMSYSELRVSREVMTKEAREIVVGSTTFLSPDDFIDDLALLGQDDE